MFSSTRCAHSAGSTRRSSSLSRVSVARMPTALLSCRQRAHALKRGGVPRPAHSARGRRAAPRRCRAGVSAFASVQATDSEIAVGWRCTPPGTCGWVRSAGRRQASPASPPPHADQLSTPHKKECCAPPPSARAPPGTGTADPENHQPANWNLKHRCSAQEKLPNPTLRARAPDAGRSGPGTRPAGTLAPHPTGVLPWNPNPTLPCAPARTSCWQKWSRNSASRSMKQKNASASAWPAAPGAGSVRKWK